MNFAEIIKRWNDEAQRKPTKLKLRVKLLNGDIAVGEVAFLGEDCVTLNGANQTVALIPFSAFATASDLTGLEGFALTTLV